MTIPRLDALTAHWIENPPMHIATSAILVALGGKRRSGAGNKKREVRGDGYVPQEAPKDDRGYPTKQYPSSIMDAALAFGGTVHLFKKNRTGKPNVN